MRYKFNNFSLYVGETDEYDMSTDVPVPYLNIKNNQSWMWDGEAWNLIETSNLQTIPIQLSQFYKNKISERDKLLLMSDWTQLPDSPLNQEVKSAWASYRQTLRDLPEQPNFPNIAFPKEP
jgi:hypothetical protein